MTKRNTKHLHFTHNWNNNNLKCSSKSTKLHSTKSKSHKSFGHKWDHFCFCFVFIGLGWVGLGCIVFVEGRTFDLCSFGVFFFFLGFVIIWVALSFVEGRLSNLCSFRVFKKNSFWGFLLFGASFVEREREREEFIHFVFFI